MDVYKEGVGTQRISCSRRETLSLYSLKGEKNTGFNTQDTEKERGIFW